MTGQRLTGTWPHAIVWRVSGQAPDRNVAPPVAANLRDAQAHAGLTTAQLAAKLEIQERQITRWRNATTTPTWPWIVALADALGIEDPGWFYVDHSDALEPAA